MIRIRKVVWEEKKEKVEMCFEYEIDAIINKLQVSGICTDCIDNQGFTEEWTFSSEGRVIDVIYSHFEETSFAVQVAEGIFRSLFLDEKDLIIEPGII